MQNANEPHSLIDCLIQEKSIMIGVGDLWLKQTNHTKIYKHGTNLDFINLASELEEICLKIGFSVVQRIVWLLL